MPDNKNEITIQDEYAVITYQEAKRRLDARFKRATDTGITGTETTATLPTKASIFARRAFDNDDHWQRGNGFIGQMPTGEGAAERTELLRRAYVPEEVISEVLDTHIENVLGNDPIIAFEDEAEENNETLEIIKEWFDKRENTEILATALRSARRESASVLRAFIPAGMVSGEGRIEAKDLREALSKIWILHEYIEKGGVIVDESTATELGLILYKSRLPGTASEVSLCEYAYLDEIGRTVWGTASAHTAKLGSEVAEPFLLGGHLPIYQMNAKAMITESVCQAQRTVNLSGTMLTRNNNLAGSRERLAVGVQPPGDWVETTDADTGVITRTFKAAAMATGPATFNFLSAQPVIDDSTGKVTAFANPNIIFTDPVPVNTFLETSAHWRKVIYSKAKMLHLLMSEDATASGKSRIEARKEFQSSLNRSKQIVDPAGKWMIEVALNIAAHFIGRPGAFLKKKIKFDAQISTIELTPEEIAQIRADYEAGIIDLQTALELRGFKNVAEIQERVKESFYFQAPKPKLLPENV